MAEKSGVSPVDSKDIDFDPKSSAMKGWKKKYYDKEEPAVDTVTKSSGEDDLSSTNRFNRKFCIVLILMSIVGGVFSYIGYVLAPESCSSRDDTIFETIGLPLFMISYFLFPISLIFCLGSLVNPDMNTSNMFFWTLSTAIILVISATIFIEYVIQDMFCGCFGFPGEDCS